MNETARQFVNQEMIAKRTQQAEAHEDAQVTTGMTFERFTNEATGDEFIWLHVDPNNNEWQKVPELGDLRVGGITTTLNIKRGTRRRSISIAFKDNARELMRYRSGGKYALSALDIVRSREVNLNADGIGIDELSKQYTDPDVAKTKPNDWQKWLIIDTGIAATSAQEIPDMQAAAD